jgi:hypothetical protein
MMTLKVLFIEIRGDVLTYRREIGFPINHTKADIKELKRQVAKDRFEVVKGGGKELMQDERLDRVGQDMYVPRLDGESDKDYRNRLCDEIMFHPNKDTETLADVLREEYERDSQVKR